MADVRDPLVEETGGVRPGDGPAAEQIDGGVAPPHMDMPGVGAMESSIELPIVPDNLRAPDVLANAKQYIRNLESPPAGMEKVMITPENAQKLVAKLRESFGAKMGDDQEELLQSMIIAVSKYNYPDMPQRIRNAVEMLNEYFPDQMQHMQWDALAESLGVDGEAFSDDQMKIIRGIVGGAASTSSDDSASSPGVFRRSVDRVRSALGFGAATADIAEERGTFGELPVPREEGRRGDSGVAAAHPIDGSSGEHAAAAEAGQAADRAAAVDSDEESNGARGPSPESGVSDAGRGSPIEKMPIDTALKNYDEGLANEISGWPNELIEQVGNTPIEEILGDMREKLLALSENIIRAPLGDLQADTLRSMHGILELASAISWDALLGTDREAALNFIQMAERTQMEIEQQYNMMDAGAALQAAVPRGFSAKFSDTLSAFRTIHFSEQLPRALNELSKYMASKPPPRDGHAVEKMVQDFIDEKLRERRGYREELIAFVHGFAQEVEGGRQAPEDFEAFVKSAPGMLAFREGDFSGKLTEILAAASAAVNGLPSDDRMLANALNIANISAENARALPAVIASVRGALFDLNMGDSDAAGWKPADDGQAKTAAAVLQELHANAQQGLFAPAFALITEEERQQLSHLLNWGLSVVTVADKNFPPIGAMESMQADMNMFNQSRGRERSDEERKRIAAADSAAAKRAGAEPVLDGIDEAPVDTRPSVASAFDAGQLNLIVQTMGDLPAGVLDGASADKTQTLQIADAMWNAAGNVLNQDAGFDEQNRLANALLHHSGLGGAIGKEFSEAVNALAKAGQRYVAVRKIH